MQEEMEMETKKFELQQIKREHAKKQSEIKNLKLQLTSCNSAVNESLDRSRFSQNDQSSKKKRRKVISLRRFKVSKDGTKRLIDEVSCRSIIKASAAAQSAVDD